MSDDPQQEYFSDGIKSKASRISESAGMRL